MQLAKSRLEAKVNPEIYQLLKQAAAITGRTLTDFVITVAYEEAKRTISEHQTLLLSLRDQQLLIDHLTRPFTPNASMQEALDVHEQYLKRKEHSYDKR